MSYDIRLKDPVSGETLHADTPHNMTGGTYALGGTTEAWLNVTYNYSEHFRRVLGAKGIRSIYGMSATDSIPILERAIEQLSGEIDDDYWKPTEGNAKAALVDLLCLAKMFPNGVWDGD